MKRILPILPLLLLALLLNGCSSVNSTVNWQNDLATAANLAAYVGASVDIEDNPERRPFYEASLAALNTLIRDENYDPSAFMVALQGLPVAELKSKKGTLVVGAAVVLWTQAMSRIEIDKSELVKVVVPAVRNGLKQALAK